MTTNPLYTFEKQCTYDFAVDGGLQGSFSSFFWLPSFAVINYFTIIVGGSCNSLGAATVSFGFTGALTALIPATGFATLTLGTVFSSLQNTNPGTLPDYPVLQVASTPVVMTIAGADLTAGLIVMQIGYQGSQ